MSVEIAGQKAEEGNVRRTRNCVQRGLIAPILPAAIGSAIEGGGRSEFLHPSGLRRLKPGYAIVAVATISLGVGAATTLFSVANGVLLRPLPFEDSDRLVQLTEIRGGRQGRVPKTAGPFIESACRQTAPRFSSTRRSHKPVT
jgi:hypothetical protein